MKKCPFCAEMIQDEAVKCRYCGEFLDERSRPLMGAPYIPPMAAYYGWNYEYRSSTELFGLPLVHIAQGVDPKTGRVRVARGIIAIGNIAFGLFALGGFAFGGLAFGGISIGLLALGGIALGGIALGGMGIGLLLAVGGMAMSLQYAIGGMALAPHTISALGTDPELIRILERLFPNIRNIFP